MKPDETPKIIVGVCREDNPRDVDEAYGAGTYARLFPDEDALPAVASSPDRAEELARDKFAELRTFLTNMRRDAADAEDPELSEYAQAIEQRLDEIAALLRSRMAERWIPVGEMLPESDGWYQIYPADVNNPANPKDLPFSFEYWLRREQERRGKGWCGCNTVTHWRRLPSAPDTERL